MIIMSVSTVRCLLLTGLAVLLMQTVGWSAPVARAVCADDSIVLDGELSETAWQKAPWQTGFVTAKVGAGMAAAAPQTRFKVVHGDSAVYVAVECDEPQIEALKAKTPWRDGAVWQDDCIEIFFDPGNEGRYYHQVMVNSLGTIFDMRAADFGLVKTRLWDGDFRAVGSVDKAAEKWRVEVELPLGTLLLGSTSGPTWSWNVTRERHAGGTLELSTWSPLEGNFHQPEKFGTIAGMPEDYSPFRLSLSEPGVGVSRSASGISRFSIALTLKNETGTDRIVRVGAYAEDANGEPISAVSDALLLRKDESAEIALPELALKVDAADAVVVFRVTEEGTGRLLKAVRKKLAARTDPVAVTLLRPCYRDCIFPGEAVDALEFEVRLSTDVTRRAAHVVSVLRGELGRQYGTLAVGIDEITSSLTMPIQDLPKGNYVLAVSVQDTAGKEVARVEKRVKKLPRPDAGSVVRVDEYRNILVDEKPFLGIGWYGSVPLDDPRTDVVALQNVVVPTVIRYPDPTPIREAFEKHRIRTVVSVESGRLFHTFAMWQKQNAHLKDITKELHTREAPSDLMRETVAKLIECVRGEPGLLGYYIADEPEIHDVRSEYLENYYLLLRELDPYHPVFVTNDTVDGLLSHGYRCSDILSPDPYSASFEYVPMFLRKINEIARPGQAWMVTPWHSTTRTHFNRPFTSAGPYPYRVFRNQYFASLAYGARGFTGYTSAFFMPEIEYRYGLPCVWREVRFLEPFFSAPPSRSEPEIRKGVRLAVRGRVSGDHVMLLVVNHTDDAIDAEIAWEPLKGRELGVLSEGRQIDLPDGVLSQRLEAGDVRIYTDLPGASRFSTTAAVEGELLQRHRNAVKPGDLLHYDNGVSITSTKGAYAPWFNQFYYYACNGITDDVGWHLTHTNADSATLEIVLPKSTPVGRVEFYTPNIRDYSIDLVGPDGATMHYSFAGNTSEHVVHGFEPSVECLKLRFTVEGVTDSPTVKGAMLREIEAYSDRGSSPVTAQGIVIPAPALEEGILFGEVTDPPYLWQEDFVDFQTAPKYYWDKRDTKWVLNPESYEAMALPGGGLRAWSVSPKGYAGMTHFIPYDPAYRFFQISIGKIEGEGYRFTSIHLGEGSGKAKCRGGINTSRPGIYTLDTHYIHDSFRTGAWKKGYLRVGSAGSGKNATGTVTPGPAFTYAWVRLGSRPMDGLAVTLGDGRPLPPVLHDGDELRFEVHLQKPAQDVTVEAMREANYLPVHINGKSSIQLMKANESGCVWAGTITVGEETDRFKASGYPVVFRAAISGAAITETYASAGFGIER